MNISGVIDTLKETRPQQLRRGEVLRLTRNVRRLEIRRGTVWLTATPAKGDVLLRSGDSYELASGSSCVMESLEDAEFSLRA